MTGECIKTISVETKYSIMSVSLDRDHVACSFQQSIIVWKLVERNDFRKGLYAKKLQEYKEHFKRFEIKINNKSVLLRFLISLLLLVLESNRLSLEWTTISTTDSLCRAARTAS